MSDQTLFDRPLIGYDASQSSHNLLTVFHRLHSKFDHSVFVYIFNPIKNYLNIAHRPVTIQKQVRQSTEGMSNVEIKIVNKQDGDNKSTNQYILEQYLKSKSTFIVLGFYGSKGKKVRSVDLSSRVRNFVYQSKITVALIKNANKNTNQVVFCCDGSEISYEGLKKAIIFAKKFGYSLNVLHTYNEDLATHNKQVKNQLKTIQDSNKSFKFEVISQKANLVQYLKSKSQLYDWVILNKNGYRGEITNKTFIGSNTTEILTEVQCNLLIL